MKYDDASWHNGGEFPADLPPEAGATHSGMFLAWALIAGIGGDYHVRGSAEDLARLRARKITPGTYFLSVCGGEFTDEDLSAEGNAFAQAYFDLEKGGYLRDYREFLVKGLASDYHVPDSWRSFDKLRPLLDRRLANWRRGRIGIHEDPWPESPEPIQPARRAARVRSADELPEDIQRKIVLEFGSDETPGVLARIAGLIGQLADAHGEAPDARIIRCVIHLAAGSRRQLEKACHLALTDPRGATNQAEYDKSECKVRDFTLPFET
jgi:hypothetical protein